MLLFMSAILCVTGCAPHWVWMNAFFSNVYELQQRIMFLSPWAYYSVCLLQGFVGKGACFLWKQSQLFGNHAPHQGLDQVCSEQIWHFPF